jgi:CheY-like chemotaxis protein
MRSSNFFSQGRADAGVKPVTIGVARGLLNTLALPDEHGLPARLQELANLLIERDALRSTEDRETTAVPTKLVLVVEDDPTVRGLAVALLEETVLDVIACASGDEAVELLKAQGGDIAMVFTDVRLEGWLDGVDLARAVRSLWPGIHVVVTSGQGGSRMGEIPSDVVFLPKPWRALDVLVQVDHAVRRPSLPVR